MDPAEEELEALSAIYGGEFFIIEPDNRVYLINIPTESCSSTDSTSIEFQFLPGYPTNAKLKYRLNAQWMPRSSLGRLTDSIDELIQDSDGCPVVHLVVETIRSFLQSELSNDLSEQQSIPSMNSVARESALSQQFFTSVPTVKSHLDIVPDRFPMTVGYKTPHIHHGEPFVDRKSVFQAHCAHVTTIAEVSLFISELLEDRKIAAATHNILSWRIVKKDKNGTQIASDCDDDGETHAGSRLLHLLTLSEANNVAVMVSRWYGGIQLGPDRFKHINNVARLLLSEQNFLSNSNETASKGQKHKNKKKK